MLKGIQAESPHIWLGWDLPFSNAMPFYRSLAPMETNNEPD